MEEKKEKLYYYNQKNEKQYIRAYSKEQAALLLARKLNKKFIKPEDIFVHISSIYVVFRRKQDYIDRAGIKHTAIYDVTDDTKYYCPGCINRQEYNDVGYCVKVKNEDIRKSISEALALVREYIPEKYRKYVFAEYNNKRYFK